MQETKAEKQETRGKKQEPRCKSLNTRDWRQEAAQFVPYIAETANY
jgi:hypothetical protein